jgi:hypothetical protein
MRDLIEKTRQAVVLWLIALGVLWTLWPPALGLSGSGRWSSPAC